MRAGVLALLPLAGCLGSPDFFAGGGGGGGGGGSKGAMALDVPAPGLRQGYGRSTDGGVTSAPPTSRSATMSTTAVSGVLVNPDLPELTVLTSFGTHSFPLFTDRAMPSSVAGDSRSDTAYVTLRKTGELVRVDNVSTTPMIVWRQTVCSEPTGVALSPTGAVAIVACFGESAAVLVDTRTMGTLLISLPGAARAVAITNNGDGNDLDEHAYLPLFYGLPTAEGSDTGRSGLVIELSLTGFITRGIPIAPVANTGSWLLQPDGGQGPNLGCAPNQLYAISIFDHWAVVPFTCASPEPPATPTSTLFSAVVQLDLNSGAEVGRPLVFGPSLGAGPSRMGGLVDVDIWPDARSVHVLSQGANRVARLEITPSGLSLKELTPLGTGPGTCSYPCMGTTTASTLGVPVSVYAVAGGVLVNDWNGRSIVGFGDARPLTPYSRAITSGSDEEAQLLGRRLFYTALDRWSANEVGSCASCHPDGLSDNITWMFGAGPRQTPALDGTFSKRDPTDHRAQNWTANFDEVYDVEGVVRNVLGGRGALVDANEKPLPLNLGVGLEGVFSRNDGLSGSARAYDFDLSAVHEWAFVERFIQRIPTNRAPMHLDAAAVARGRQLFQNGGCFLCHGGDKWTVSRVPYEPSPVKTGSLPGDNGVPAAATGLRTQLRDGGVWPGVNWEPYKVAVEALDNPDGGAPLHVGPERITCVLRQVFSYDTNDLLERKPDGSRSQGAHGFNPPSLLGLATSAPYFHNGSARTLTEVFDRRNLSHTQAGNGQLDLSPQEISDLVAFLMSIDETTPTFPVTRDLCGGY